MTNKISPPQVRPLSTQFDEVTSAQIAIFENPELAERQGLVRDLIASGDHEPAGLTVISESDSSKTKVVKPHHVQRDMRYPIAIVEIGGHRRAVRDILAQIAGRAHQESVIVVKSTDGTVVQLNTMPTREEAMRLHELGAIVRGMDGNRLYKPSVKLGDEPSL